MRHMKFWKTVFVIGWIINGSIIATLLVEACGHKKAAPVKQVDTVLVETKSPYFSVTDEGKFFVMNLGGDTIVKGDIHDTLRVPCKTCKPKNWMSCKQYAAENKTLRKLIKDMNKDLTNCVKGNTYEPTDTTK